MPKGKITDHVTSTLADRVRVLEAKDAIRELKARYAYTLDSGDIDSYLELFVDDAVIDNPMGRYQGKETHRENLQEAFKIMPFFVHMYVSPIIEILGESQAKGTWYLFDPETMVVKGREKAVWACCRYDERYVKVHDEWKFQEVKVTQLFQTSFNRGWVREKQVVELRLQAGPNIEAGSGVKTKKQRNK